MNFNVDFLLSAEHISIYVEFMYFMVKYGDIESTDLYVWQSRIDVFCCAAKVIWRMSLKGISPSYSYSDFFGSSFQFNFWSPKNKYSEFEIDAKKMQ